MLQSTKARFNHSYILINLDYHHLRGFTGILHLDAPLTGAIQWRDVPLTGAIYGTYSVESPHKDWTQSQSSAPRLGAWLQMTGA